MLDVGGHNGSLTRPEPEEAADQEPIGRKARHVAEVADPDQDLGKVELDRTRVRRD